MAKNKLNIENLLNHPLINKNDLARTIWPEVGPKSATSKLYMKKNGTNGNRFTEEDKVKIDKYIQDFISDIYE